MKSGESCESRYCSGLVGRDVVSGYEIPVLLVEILLVVLQEDSHLLEQSGQTMSGYPSRMRFAHVREGADKQTPLIYGEPPNVFYKGSEGAVCEKILFDIGSVKRRYGISVFLEVGCHGRERLGSGEVSNDRYNPVAALHVPDEVVVLFARQKVPKLPVEI